jgi:hypothetical protein
MFSILVQNCLHFRPKVAIAALPIHIFVLGIVVSFIIGIFFSAGGGGSSRLTLCNHIYSLSIYASIAVTLLHFPFKVVVIAIL